MTKRVHINEDKIHLLLNEYVTDKCYHFCSIENLKKILNSNQFTLRTNVVSKSEHWYQPKRRFFLSLTRNKNPMVGYSSMFIGTGYARIELDGSALNMNYRAHPINYFARGEEELIYGSPAEREMYQSQKSTSDINKTQDNVENEDRIFSSRPNIPNADKYITRIDIVPSMDGYISYEEAIYHLLSSIDRKWYGLIHIYSTSKDLQYGKEITNIAFPTKRKAEELPDENEEGSVIRMSEIALIDLGFLKSFVDINEGNEISDPMQYASEVAKKYRLPLFFDNIRNEYDESFRKLITYAENKDHSRLVSLFEKRVPRLEWAIKALNTTYTNNRIALAVIKAVTNEIRKMGINTIALYPKGRDVRGKNITSVWDDIREKL